MNTRWIRAVVGVLLLLTLAACNNDCAKDPAIAAAEYRVVGGTRPELEGAIVSVTDWGLVIMWVDEEGPHAGAYRYRFGAYYDSGDPADSGIGAAE